VHVFNDVVTLPIRDIQEGCQGLLLHCYRPLGTLRMKDKKRVVVIAPVVKEEGDETADLGD
jgi:hypothetical protein